MKVLLLDNSLIKIVIISLSTVVLNSRNQQGKLWLPQFLNQAHAWLLAVHAWFIEIVSFRTSACVRVCVCLPRGH